MGLVKEEVLDIFSSPIAELNVQLSLTNVQVRYCKN